MYLWQSPDQSPALACDQDPTATRQPWHWRISAEPRLPLMWEQNSRWTGAKRTHAKRVLTPMHQYQKCNQKKRKYRRRREPAHHFDDKSMFHQSLGKGTHFLFWVGIVKARKGPTLQIWVQKCPMHCPASTCRLLPLPRCTKRFKCLSTASDREKNLSIYIQTKSWRLTSREESAKNTSNYL